MTIKRFNRTYTVEYIINDVIISVGKDLHSVFVGKIVNDENGLFDHYMDSELLTIGNENRGMLGNMVNGIIPHTTLAVVYHRIKRA